MSSHPILKDFVAMKTTDPHSEVFLCAAIHVAFGRGGSVVFFFGGGAFRSFGVVLVHGAKPFGGEFAGVDYAAKASPLMIAY